MAEYSKSLEVFIGDDAVGVVSQDSSGGLEFSYHEDYDSTPLSLSMPVTNTVYKDKVVSPYLMGLLPDNLDQRKALARAYNVSAGNPIALLNFIGLDCPGAVKFAPSAEAETSKRLKTDYVPLSLEEIGHELSRIMTDEQTSWQLPKEHWSLGGTQSKIALACFEGDWFRCEGDAATTHIIKPGIARLRYEALNECICQNLACATGLPAAKTGFEIFGNIPALVSERFDRVIEPHKTVIRLHQEDLCQALSIKPDNKYASEGGPSARDILALLSRHENASENKIAFTLQLFFNYLIGASDAHGKNYAILLSGKNVELAPLYDCASALAYDADETDYRTAMSIGGENRLFRLKKSNVLKYAEQAQMSDEICLDLANGLATQILKKLDGVFAEFETFEGTKELATRMKPKIIRNCEAVIKNLS